MWVLPVDMDSNDLKEGIKASQFDFTESTTNFLKDQLTVRPPHLGDALQQIFLVNHLAYNTTN